MQRRRQGKAQRNSALAILVYTPFPTRLSEWSNTIVARAERMEALIAQVKFMAPVS